MSSRQGLLHTLRKLDLGKLSLSSVTFVRHPLNMMAVYDMVTAVHTAMEGFYYANHFDRPLLGRAESEKELIEREMRAYGIYYSLALLAVVAFVMSLVLIAATYKVKTRLLVLWMVWESIYLVAHATLSVLGFQHVGVDAPFQVVYLVLPRIIGLFGIFVAFVFVYTRRSDRHDLQETLIEGEKNKDLANGESKTAWSSQNTTTIKPSA